MYSISHDNSRNTDKPLYNEFFKNYFFLTRRKSDKCLYTHNTKISRTISEDHSTRSSIEVQCVYISPCPNFFEICRYLFLILGFSCIRLKQYTAAGDKQTTTASRRTKRVSAGWKHGPVAHFYWTKPIKRNGHVSLRGFRKKKAIFLRRTVFLSRSKRSPYIPIVGNNTMPNCRSSRLFFAQWSRIIRQWRETPSGRGGRRQTRLRCFGHGETSSAAVQNESRDPIRIGYRSGAKTSAYFNVCLYTFCVNLNEKQAPLIWEANSHNPQVMLPFGHIDYCRNSLFNNNTDFNNTVFTCRKHIKLVI